MRNTEPSPLPQPTKFHSELRHPRQGLLHSSWSPYLYLAAYISLLWQCECDLLCGSSSFPCSNQTHWNWLSLRQGMCCSWYSSGSFCLHWSSGCRCIHQRTLSFQVFKVSGQTDCSFTISLRGSIRDYCKYCNTLWVLFSFYSSCTHIYTSYSQWNLDRTELEKSMKWLPCLRRPGMRYSNPRHITIHR
jgi:hypothetical protein